MENSIMEVDYIEADYFMETNYEIEQVASIMAGEQSCGTFISVPGETESIKQRFSAIVTNVHIVDCDAQRPALPSTGWAQHEKQKMTRAVVTLRWPAHTIGASLPNMLSTVAGNLFELKQITGLKILDIRLPESFLKRYTGPRFGITGTRKLTQIMDGPLIGTIIKPSVGLSAIETAEMVKNLCEAGIDFIKDDELQSDSIHCPFEDRVKTIMHVINKHADRSGRKVMYAFNLTGDLDQMRMRHDLLLKYDATCLMVSLNSVGLTGFIELARMSHLPIHAHRNGWGYLSRSPNLGWTFKAWHKIWRLAGADHMHVNGLSNKFSETDESVICSARSCLTPLYKHTPCLTMPVFSSGQTARVIEKTYNSLQTSDLIFAAGGGILGHPNGLAAGVRSLKLAWQLVLNGHNITEAANQDDDLKMALDMKS